MTKLLKEGKVINKKKSEGQDPFYSNIKNQEHHPSLNKVESKNKDQTSIEIPNQIEVNITKQQHKLETPIAKKKSKALNIPIPIINENIETPMLKNTKSNPPTLEISNFQELEAELYNIKSYIKCEISDLTQKIDSVTQNVHETLKGTQ